MDKQLISVILPIYNVEKYICQCVESILIQSYKNIEIILVDDGSPDNCSQICDNYALQDKRVKVIHKENGGLVSAWMRGIEETSNDAKFVIFIDPDDWISEQYIECLVRTQNNSQADVVVSPMVRAYPDHNEEGKIIAEAKFYEGEVLINELYPILLNAGGFEQRGVPTSRCSKLIKKQLILDNECYCKTTTTYSEDLNIIFPVLLDAESIAIIEEKCCKYFYRYNPYSMLNAYDKNMVASIEHVHPTLVKVCQDKGKQQFIPQVYADFLAASVQYYKNELLNPNGLKQARENINNYSKKHMFREAVQNVQWRHYRKLNVLIIQVMCTKNPFFKNVVTGILFVLKRVRISRQKKLINNMHCEA